VANKYPYYLIIILLITASFITFGRISGNEFILIADLPYTIENSHIRSGINWEAIKWAITDTETAAYWHPVTWLSHMLDWTLFGTNPSGHHIVSLTIHIITVIFVFLFFNKTTKDIWPSAFVAFFLALHPLRVESIAYLAERCGILCMMFGAMSLYAYAMYAEKLKTYWYLLCLILFSLSLMSKAYTVTFPFVMILLDYWPLKRWQEVMNKSNNRFYSVRWLIYEKIPFILLTIAFSAIAVRAQIQDGFWVPFQKFPIIERIANAAVSYIDYLKKIFWPHDLAIIYPYSQSLPFGKVLICGFVLVIITIGVTHYRKKASFLFVGWFWFLGTLVPVIWVPPVLGRMADRYTYLPSVGIAIMLAWGGLLFSSKTMCKKIFFPMGLVLMSVLSFLSWQQSGYWKNNYTLFNHAFQVMKKEPGSSNYRGFSLLEEEKIEHDIIYYTNESNILKDHYKKLINYPISIEYYNETIITIRAIMEAYFRRGISYALIGKYEKAFEDWNNAINIKEYYAKAYNKRAVYYINHGDREHGCMDLRTACVWGDCKLLTLAKRRDLCR
jgi:tetratricopeptide (TPR) repeat protein